MTWSIALQIWTNSNARLINTSVSIHCRWSKPLGDLENLSFFLNFNLVVIYIQFFLKIISLFLIFLINWVLWEKTTFLLPFLNRFLRWFKRKSKSVNFFMKQHKRLQWNHGIDNNLNGIVLEKKNCLVKWMSWGAILGMWSKFEKKIATLLQIILCSRSFVGVDIRCIRIFVRNVNW